MFYFLSPNLQISIKLASNIFQEYKYLDTNISVINSDVNIAIYLLFCIWKRFQKAFKFFYVAIYWYRGLMTKILMLNHGHVKTYSCYFYFHLKNSFIKSTCMEGAVLLCDQCLTLKGHFCSDEKKPHHVYIQGC